MERPLTVSKDSVVVLLKGGRLPSWDALTPEQQLAYSQEHVDLMLSVAREHRMVGIEGFRLMADLQRWSRFWVVEFPTLEGAEAWIDAEMAPPAGLHSYHEYHLARRWGPDFFADWIAHPPAPRTPGAADPHVIPPLDIDRGSVVVLLFGRWLPGAEGVDPRERGDDEHDALMKSVARERGLTRIEAYALIGPQPDWHRAWVMEFPDLAGAEAWMEAETRPPHGRFSNKTYHLARRWAPDYFATWASR